MIMKKGNSNKRKFCLGPMLAAFMIVLVWSPAWIVNNAQAQENASDQQGGRFIDEDGDGFNDLLPDSDGDGIPDLIDPDFKGHPAESLYMNRYMDGQAVEIERNRFQNMQQHGEPGQFGPVDSTGHGSKGGHGSSPGGPGMSGDQGGQGGPGMGGDQGGGSPVPPAGNEGEKIESGKTDNNNPAPDGTQDANIPAGNERP